MYKVKREFSATKKTVEDCLKSIIRKKGNNLRFRKPAVQCDVVCTGSWRGSAGLQSGKSDCTGSRLCGNLCCKL